MKALIEFSNGEKIVAEENALVLPFPAHMITSKIPLDPDKPDAIEALEKNPGNAFLLAQAKK